MTPMSERLKRLMGWSASAAPATTPSASGPHESAFEGYQVAIAPDDPLVAFFEREHDPVLVERLPIDTPGVRALREAGVALVVPLVSQGELVGLLNLGPRMGEQEYSADDRALLNNLATQAAPAVRVAQLVRRQQLEAQARERIEQELRVARLIQETLLPKEVPMLPGWNIAALWRPAREVGGDFYDFIRLSDGRLVLIIGDVTDKGVPAAMVMATTRTMLRSAAFDTDSPGYVLQIVNDRLCREIPPKMFVTCLYAVLEPNTGHLSYANAGHDLPYCTQDGRTRELRATGMPLGLLPGMRYEERETVIEEGESVLFYSDGLVEAHNPAREMLGFPRLGALVAHRPPGHSMIDYLMNELTRFTGAGWEQEDDVTVVTLDRSPAPSPPPPLPVASMKTEAVRQADEWQRLDRFDLPSVPGNEREALRRVALAIEPLGLPEHTVERIKTAVAEAVMNAIEHGNLNQPELLAEIEVYASPHHLVVRITDQGLNKTIPPAQTPDLDAKLAGLQSPRGWGLFLIEKMVDRVRTHADESHHTVELEIDL